MTAAAVSVIVPCHNYGPYLDEALASLAGQTMRPTEVVVVDDGSTDQTSEVLQRWLEDEASALPLRVLRHEKPLGVVAAMRAGIGATTAPYFAIIDADDYCEPHYLERLAATLDANPAAGFAYPRMRLFGSEHGIYASYDFDIPRLLFLGNYIPMVSLIRRHVFDRSLGFRQLPTHIDWDLWLSFAEAGSFGVRVDEVLYNWRRHAGAMTNQTTATRLVTRLNILRRHWRLVLRHLHWALPWTAVAVWRAVRMRFPGDPKVRRSTSAWVEADG